MMTIIFILLKSVLLIARFTGIFSISSDFSYIYFFLALEPMQKLRFVSMLLLLGYAFINELVLIEILFSIDVDLYIYLMREQLIDMNMYTLDIEREFTELREICDIKQRILDILGCYQAFYYIVQPYNNSFYSLDRGPY